MNFVDGVKESLVALTRVRNGFDNIANSLAGVTHFAAEEVERLSLNLNFVNGLLELPRLPLEVPEVLVVCDAHGLGDECVFLVVISHSCDWR